jgi:hypothetical protein
MQIKTIGRFKTGVVERGQNVDGRLKMNMPWKHLGSCLPRSRYFERHIDVRDIPASLLSEGTA